MLRKSKNMFKLYFLILFIISIINGCSSVDYQRSAEQKAPVYEAPPASDISTQPKVITTAALQNNPQTVAQKRTTPASRQAVLDLLKKSKAAMDNNQYGEAENLLKRAIRIEPGNAWLWHNMAVLKFYQEDYQQAIQQAMKSNNLEKNNPQLTASNKKIIKQSYIELGE